MGMSVLVSKSLRVWMLVAIAVAVASGHPSAAKQSPLHKLDAALAGLAGKEGHRTRVIIRLRQGDDASVREVLRRHGCFRSQRRPPLTRS